MRERLFRIVLFESSATLGGIKGYPWFSMYLHFLPMLMRYLCNTVIYFEIVDDFNNFLTISVHPYFE